MRGLRQGLFITGTDTGVGKTVVCAALVSLLRQRGMDAVPMKPVQTGCRRRGARLMAPDLECCLRLAGVEASESEKLLMAPYRFTKACSPHLAAAIEHRRVNIRTIIDSFHKLRQRHEFVVVEGAGGILVPLNERDTMLELMLALALPVVLVARLGLGTINHTLLALRELRRARIPVAGVIFNETSKRKLGIVEHDNVAVIGHRGRVQILGRFPFISNWMSRAFQVGCARHLGPIARYWS